MTVEGSRNAKVAQALAGIVLVVVLLGMILNATGLVAARGDPTARLLQLVTMLPMLFYLVAIWTIHRAFGALARGEAVESILARLLGRVGACLFLGGLARVFAEPLLTRLILDRSWPYGNFDVAAITLGTVGLLLMLLSAPLRDAAAMRTELAEIFVMPMRVTLDAVLTDRGMTGKQLAQHVGLSETQLSLFRSGRVRGIRFATLARLCLVLDCQPGALLAYAADPADLAG